MLVVEEDQETQIVDLEVLVAVEMVAAVMVPPGMELMLLHLMVVAAVDQEILREQMVDQVSLQSVIKSRQSLHKQEQLVVSSVTMVVKLFIYFITLAHLPL
jgi:hypothetical protein|tara:strand:+ start:751 stop:1053 length:303 start_codon:yes stop_codon:yes gene_type:complete